MLTASSDVFSIPATLLPLSQLIRLRIRLNGWNDAALLLGTTSQFLFHPPLRTTCPCSRRKGPCFRGSPAECPSGGDCVDQRWNRVRQSGHLWVREQGRSCNYIYHRAQRGAEYLQAAGADGVRGHLR